MRSARVVFSLSIKPPHAATILSSSPELAAAMQGAGSGGASAAGAGSVAREPCGSGLHSRTAMVMERINPAQRRVINRPIEPCETNRPRSNLAQFQPIMTTDFLMLDYGAFNRWRGLQR